VKNALPLQQEKKLVVTYRVESGCLGPQGESHISKFCGFAQSKLRTLDSDYVVWNIEPRDNKTLPEMQYSVLGKRITHAQAEKYLSVFGEKLDEFECHLSDKLACIIDEFMGH